jgi:hypothetical protein
VNEDWKGAGNRKVPVGRCRGADWDRGVQAGLLPDDTAVSAFRFLVCGLASWLASLPVPKNDDHMLR